MGRATTATEIGVQCGRDELLGLVDALPDAAVVVDGRGITRFVNHAAEEFFGRKKEEFVGEVAPFSTREDRPENVELVVGGRTREGELRVIPIAWAGERALLAVVRDVTDQHAQRERRRRAEELHAVGRLAGGIAHDFNNLLTGIMTFTNLVRDTLDADDERRTDLGQVLASGKRAMELTRNLLAFSRKEPGSPRPTDLNGLIESYRPLVERLLGDRIKLERQLSQRVWPVLLDPGHFEVMLTKLAANARDAMVAGGTLCIETMNEANPVLGECVLCRISDDGEGMNDEVKQNLFHPFFTTKALGKGTGLGLATVYGLLLQAKGTVEVYSKLGRGTAFELRFPRAPTGATSNSPPSSLRPSKAPGPRQAILLAEDEPIVRQSVGRMLRRGGYTYFEARTGQEALAVFADHGDEIGLALLDVVMPELSGPEAAMRLRKATPSLKILFMSGYPRDLFDTNEEARNLGPLIQKPMTEAALLAEVRRLLEEDEEKATLEANEVT